MLGTAIARIRSDRAGERARDEALAALDLAGTAVVTSDPEATELRLYDSARTLLAEIDDADECVHRLIAPAW